MKSDFSSRKSLFWGFFILTAIIHIGSYYLSEQIYPDFKWKHYPVHTFLELTGSFIGIIVAFIIIKQDEIGVKSSYGQVLARALIVISLLDGVHSILHTGNQFVWFHSLATLWGGILFSLVYLPKKYQSKIGPLWFHLLLALSVTTAQILYPSLIPEMVVNGKFTTFAVFSNVLGGVLMLLAAIRLFLTYQKNKEFDDLLFVLHCSFFGAAAVMFQQSTLWDIAWWGWHILRFLAYIAALWFGAHSLFFINSKIVSLNNLNQIVNNLQRANDELTQFAYRTSHDLKSPLVTSKGLLSLIAEDIEVGNTKEAKANIKKIYRQIEKLENLISDILNLVKADSQEIEEKQINFPLIIDDIKERLDSIIKQAKCQFLLEINHNKTIYLQKTRLTQILENLISNAIKYHDHSKKECFVKVTTQVEDSNLIIHIEDNGIGIAKKHHKDVFTMFKRFSPEAHFGSGLGLSIVKKHVDTIGGEISFSSTLNIGTIFKIVFPIKDKDA